MADARQREWIARVLGVNVGPGSGASGEAGNQRPPKDGPLVAYRKSLLFFESAHKRVRTDLGALSALIVKHLPDEAKLADKVAADIDEFCGTLRDSIDDGINAVAEEKPERNKQIRAQILDLMDSVAANKLIAHVDGNPVMPLSVAPTLIAALGRVADSIV